MFSYRKYVKSSNSIYTDLNIEIQKYEVLKNEKH